MTDSIAHLRSRQEELVRRLAVENSTQQLAALSEELESVSRRIQDTEAAKDPGV
ncbi:hypothetical protein [Arthrobacter sp. VKM Ac-2550]|uniref:hypothetical protein n=1 Tax=Crystallibacter permensis TaxID=1938888 RepID=UPI002225EE5C|nr:hypothetical protein [Arthrobacter sp. VKM Ac-2550]